MTYLKIPKAVDMHWFTRCLPTDFQVGGEGIPYKVNLATISKRLGIHYGVTYRPTKVDLIRNDLMEYYKICRDIENKPYHILELDGGWGGKASEARLREALDPYTFRELWQRFPVPEEYYYDWDTSPVIPLFRVPAYATKAEVEEYYPEVNFFDLSILNRKVAFPIYSSYQYGTPTSKGRGRVYRKDLAHLLSIEAIDPRQNYDVDQIVQLCRKHGVYDIYPYCVSPSHR